MNVKCPSCSQLLALDASLAGQVVACPHCGQAMQAPQTVSPTPVAPVQSPSAQLDQNNQFAIKPIKSPQQRSSEEAPSHSSTIFRVEGAGSVLEVFEDRVALTPKGITGFLVKGIKGTKEIPFTSIVAIQLKELTTFTSGYIQFTISGGSESDGGLFDAVKDENTFMFKGKKNNEQVVKIKHYIDAAIRKSKMPQAPAPTASLSDELHKLGELRQQGVLSEAEFQAAKKKLIG